MLKAGVWKETQGEELSTRDLHLGGGWPGAHLPPHPPRHTSGVLEHATPSTSSALIWRPPSRDRDYRLILRTDVGSWKHYVIIWIARRKYLLHVIEWDDMSVQYSRLQLKEFFEPGSIHNTPFWTLHLRL